MKPLVVIQGPVGTRSGYGEHARDIVRSFIALDRYDVRIISTRWGGTPMNALSENDKDIIDRLLTNPLPRKPDIFVQITVANEFNPIGAFNIGITAGIETTAVPHNWIEGANRMDLVIVPSVHSETVFKKTEFTAKDDQGRIVGKVFFQKPIEVLFEGTNVEVFGNGNDSIKLEDVATDFNFLFVGHWLSGDFGHDRKNIGKLINTFFTVFKDYPKEKQPGLILKTSGATFSVMDREHIIEKIDQIKNRHKDRDNLPPVYLLHGDLTQDEMASLFNHDKVKVHVSFTKGEGFGRPLLEASLSGKPVIATNWSGHIDFLQDATLLSGKIEQVHESAANDHLIRESGWFDVNLTDAATQFVKVFEDYDQYVKSAKMLAKKNKQNFSFDKMTQRLDEILNKYTKMPEKIDIKLPSLKDRKKRKKTLTVESSDAKTGTEANV